MATLPLPAIDVMGLKSAPSATLDADEDAVDTAADGNRGLDGGIDAPLTGGCMPGGIPGIPDIILQKEHIKNIRNKLETKEY